MAPAAAQASVAHSSSAPTATRAPTPNIIATPGSNRPTPASDSLTEMANTANPAQLGRAVIQSSRGLRVLRSIGSDYKLANGDPQWRRRARTLPFFSYITSTPASLVSRFVLVS